jgi:hypothetical protein
MTARLRLTIRRAEFKLINKQLIGNDLAESGNGVLGLLSGNMAGQTYKNH